MAVDKINIEDFLKLANQYPVIDVRSPGEYIHAQIPGAYSLPLFNDEERKVIGTAYKQQSRETAIKMGLSFFGVKMKKLVEDVEEIINNRLQTVGNTQLHIDNLAYRQAGCLLIHCWRGGMRSGAVAWLLDMYGFKVYTLAGGYKAFRTWALQQFNKAFNFKILGGYTGSGKTLLLQEFKRKGYPVIDLENLANHKGSAFGAIGEKPQPTQEMFENLLAMKLNEIRNKKNEIWIEDESQRIGKLIIPNSFWEKMRTSPVYFLEIPFEERLNYLVNTYGNFDSDKLQESIERIQKRLGGLETKNALQFLKDDNIIECFRILLNYYDKLYTKSLHNRENIYSILNKIHCDDINSEKNAQKILLPITVEQ